jgi:hypothetical protein
VVFQDESEMALLNHNGNIQFKMQIGPNFSDAGFLDNERAEYQGKKEKSLLYSISKEHILRLVSIPQ